MRHAGARKLGWLERLQIAPCISGVQLTCGCRAGVYETFDQVVLTIVDDPDDNCPERGHQADFVITEVRCGGQPPSSPRGEAA